MTKSDGASLTSRLSRLYRTNAAIETAFLISLGVLAVTVHAYLRLPIKVPGHKGLFWIGLLIVGRLLSKRPWAATTTSTSAAITSLLPAMGFKDPLDTVAFFISGLVVDAGFRIAPRLVVSLWGIALIGAVAHSTKPLAKLVVSGGSLFTYQSLLSGVAYPLTLHALFGAAAALIAALAVRQFRRNNQDEIPR